MKLQLYLGGEELELTSSLQFPLNKIYEDLSSPTNYIVEYSKQIQIPFTKHNCKLLGNIYRLDKTILYNEDNIGLYLDPNRRIPMQLVYNSEIVLEGYAKYVSANIQNKSKVFNLNIFGQLGEIFKQLKSLVTDIKQLKNTEYEGDERFVINDFMTPTRLNASYVRDNWLNDEVNLEDPSKTAVQPYNIIGLAPTFRGNYPEFKSDTIFLKNWLDKKDQFIQLEDFINNQLLHKLTAEYGDAKRAQAELDAGQPGQLAEKLNMDYRMHQFRPFNLKPYIYFNKLMYMFKSKCKELTGYDLVLDENWFNSKNPYWSRACYFMDFLESKGSKTKSDLNLFDLQVAPGRKEGVTLTESKNNFTNKFVYENTVDSEDIKEFSNVHIEPFKINLLTNYTSKNDIVFKATGQSAPVDHCGKYLIHLSFYDVYDNTEHILSSVGYVTSEDPYKYQKLKSLPGEGGTFLGSYPQFQNYKRGEVYSVNTIISIPEQFVKPNYVFKGKCRMKYSIEAYIPRLEKGLYEINNNPYNPEDFNELSSSMNLNKVSHEFNPRLRLTMKLKNIYNSEKPLFDIVLQYTKMFGLQWRVDYKKKEVIISSRKSVFENYTITDWTNKIDRSKPFIITPVIFKFNKIKFNYEEKDGYRYTGYKEKYDKVYGEKIINTHYQFGSDTKELFQSVNPSCMSSRTFLSLPYLINNWHYGKPLSTQPSKWDLPDCDDEEEKNSTQLNNWYFRLPNQITEEEFFVTDDTELMASNNTYCWVNPKEYSSAPIKNIPFFSIGYVGDFGTYGFNFGESMEDYTYSKIPTACINNFIYDICWKDYLNERYNLQNKKVECYVNLTPYDYMTFQFNKLVTIDNQLFMVNKINDFDINLPMCSTKVELIQITNLNSYLTGDIK